MLLYRDGRREARGRSADPIRPRRRAAERGGDHLELRVVSGASTPDDLLHNWPAPREAAPALTVTNTRTG